MKPSAFEIPHFGRSQEVGMEFLLVSVFQDEILQLPVSLQIRT